MASTRAASAGDLGNCGLPRSDQPDVLRSCPNRVRRIRRTSLWVCLVVIGLAGAACAPDPILPSALAGFERIPAPLVDETPLPDVANRGEPFEFRAIPDGLLLVYFGYTSCPDVCPTTLSDVRLAIGSLGVDRSRVTLAMATVDPNRDTADVLTRYVQTFVGDAHALRTTDDAQLALVAEDFGVVYDVNEAADGEIEVIHSGSLYAVDETGTLLVSWPFGTPWADVASDVRQLLDRTVT